MYFIKKAISHSRAAKQSTGKRLGGAPRKGCNFPMSPVLCEQRRAVCYQQTKCLAVRPFFGSFRCQHTKLLTIDRANKEMNTYIKF